MSAANVSCVSAFGPACWPNLAQSLLPRFFCPSVGSSSPSAGGFPLPARSRIRRVSARSARRPLFWKYSAVRKAETFSAPATLMSWLRGTPSRSADLPEIAARPDARIAPMPKPSATARARKIKLILFDVDGVLTDGKIWIFPAPGGSQSGDQQSILEKSAQHGGQGGFGLHSTTLIEAKGFHAHDGTAISLARLAGIKTGIITKRLSETVALRARDLKIDHVHQGIQDKAGVMRQILEK